MSVDIFDLTERLVIRHLYRKPETYKVYLAFQDVHGDYHIEEDTVLDGVYAGDDGFAAAYQWAEQRYRARINLPYDYYFSSEPCEKDNIGVFVPKANLKTTIAQPKIYALYIRKDMPYRIDHVDINGNRLIPSETGNAEFGAIISGTFKTIDGYSPVIDEQVVGNGKTMTIQYISTIDPMELTDVNVLTLVYLEDVVEEEPAPTPTPTPSPTPTVRPTPTRTPDDGYISVEEGDPEPEVITPPVTMEVLLPSPETVRRSLYISDADVPLGTGIAGLTIGEAVE